MQKLVIQFESRQVRKKLDTLVDYTRLTQNHSLQEDSNLTTSYPTRGDTVRRSYGAVGIFLYEGEDYYGAVVSQYRL